MDTITSLTLLEGLKDRQDTQAWRRFNTRYGPMVTAFAKKLGLKDADAQDVGQETMLAFVKFYGEGRYDRDKGRLRSWLFGIAHRKAVDVQRRRAREMVVVDSPSGTGVLDRIESPEDANAVWEQEWQRAVLRACLEEVAKQLSANTVKAFELYVLRQWPVDKVAVHLGTSNNAVYIAKNRAMERIRKIKAEMEEIW